MYPHTYIPPPACDVKRKKHHSSHGWGKNKDGFRDLVRKKVSSKGQNRHCSKHSKTFSFSWMERKFRRRRKYRRHSFLPLLWLVYTMGLRESGEIPTPLPVPAYPSFLTNMERTVVRQYPDLWAAPWARFPLCKLKAGSDVKIIRRLNTASVKRFSPLSKINFAI